MLFSTTLGIVDYFPVVPWLVAAAKSRVAWGRCKFSVDASRSVEKNIGTGGCTDFGLVIWNTLPPRSNKPLVRAGGGWQMGAVLVMSDSEVSTPKVDQILLKWALTVQGLLLPLPARGSLYLVFDVEACLKWILEPYVSNGSFQKSGAL